MIINGFGGSSGGSVVGDNQARVVRNDSGKILYRINTSVSPNSRLGYQDYFNAPESVVIGTYTCNAGFSMGLNSTQGTSGKDLVRYGVYQTASYTLPNDLYDLWGIPGMVVAKYTDNSGIASKKLWTLSSTVYNTNSAERVNILIKSYYNYPLSKTPVQSTGTGYSPQSVSYDHWGLNGYSYSSNTWVYIGTPVGVVIDDSHKFQVEFFNAGSNNINSDEGAITFTNVYTWTVTFKFFPCMLY